jgi:hypothetical protein
MAGPQGGKANFATVARVRLSNRIRVIVLLQEIETDIPPNNTIEVMSPQTFTEEATTLARLARLLRKLKREEVK